MYVTLNKKYTAVVIFVLALFFAWACLCAAGGVVSVSENKAEQKGFIKWVDFNIPERALTRAYKADVEAHENGNQANWIEVLAYCAAKNGGGKNSFPDKDIDYAVSQLEGGVSAGELSQNLKYYDYYYEAYSAVLSGLVGEYEIQVYDENESSHKKWVKKYGLKGFHPIAKNYWYTESDDFGNSRSYGYKRKHLGHDMMGSVGTPIIAVESGIVDTMGWNMYGGWRIGIRSFDGTRYYYYAHLRKDSPYPMELKEGCVVSAGDVIGYMGMTGYSTKENVNNMNVCHLHFGLQLIFDESQKEGNGEIWIDVYGLTKFLSKNRSETYKNEDTGERERVYKMDDPAANEAS